jgi:hypothetical protein
MTSACKTALRIVDENMVVIYVEIDNAPFENCAKGECRFILRGWPPDYYLPL